MKQVAASSSPAVQQPGVRVEEVMAQLAGTIDEDWVRQTDAVFSFVMSDTKAEYFLDLKTGSGLELSTNLSQSWRRHFPCSLNVKALENAFNKEKADYENLVKVRLQLYSGSCGPGQAPVEVDATLSMSSENFSKLFSGQLRTTTAFISGRMKISGNLGKATRLEKLLAKLQSQNPNKVQSEATFVESKPVMKTPWTDEVLRFSGSFH